MSRQFVVFGMVSVAILTSAVTLAQVPEQNRVWNNAGWYLLPPPGPSAPAPRRDLSGIWDAGGKDGTSGGGFVAPPFTPLGEQMARAIKPGNGPRVVSVEEMYDPQIFGDPGGFPRLVLFELKPFEIVQTSNKVLMMYLWEKRWRTIWTDGRALPKDPDPRWYGFSVGRWEDDYTFVVDTVGMDDRSWLDNAGNPHSDSLHVEEIYHRVDRDNIEYTVTLNDPKVYTKPWKPRDKQRLALMPNNLDFMEMIPVASEAIAYEKKFINRIKPQAKP